MVVDLRNVSALVSTMESRELDQLELLLAEAMAKVVLERELRPRDPPIPKPSLVICREEGGGNE